MARNAVLWARFQDVRAPAGKSVLLALAHLADKGGVCRRPQVEIAAAASCSLTSVKRWVPELEARGLLSRARRGRAGKSQIDIITLRLDRSVPVVRGAAEKELAVGDRLFELEAVGPDPAHRRKLPTIRCPDCGCTEHFGWNGVKMPPPEAAAQHFRKLGWRVGGGPRADQCPQCQAKRQNKPKTSVPAPVAPLVPPPPPSPSELPPRTMTYADRRLVMIKIEEVYMDEHAGYVAPWSDQKVADDLNVPRAWVTELREQNFGPAEGDGAELRALRAEIAGLREEVAVAFAKARIDAEAAEKRVNAVLDKAQAEIAAIIRQAEADFDDIVGSAQGKLRGGLVQVRAVHDKIEALAARAATLDGQGRG